MEPGELLVWILSIIGKKGLVLWPLDKVQGFIIDHGFTILTGEVRTGHPQNGICWHLDLLEIETVMGKESTASKRLNK